MVAKCLSGLGLVACLVLVSCGSGDGDDAGHREEPVKTGEQINRVRPVSEGELVRGHFVFGHEVRSLRPCGTERSLWVVDSTRLLQQLHTELSAGSDPYAEVFVVVTGNTGPPPTEGFGVDHAGTLTVEEVFYAAREGFDCDFDWSRFQYRSQGNEPFWTIEVRPPEMRLIRPGQTDMIWTQVVASQDGENVIVATGDEAGSPVALTITPEPGRDSMSGAYFGLSALLVLDGQSYKGPALRGTWTSDP